MRTSTFVLFKDALTPIKMIIEQMMNAIQGGNSMVYPEYHKGYPCVFKPILCQEGFCSECAIYLGKSLSIDMTNLEQIRTDDSRKNMRQLQEARFCDSLGG